MANDAQATPRLSTLPEEICVQIVDYLDMPSTIALHQTSRLFRRLSDPYDNTRRDQLAKFLREAQDFARWQGDGLACFTCRKVVHKRHFSIIHTKGKRGKNGYQQESRFCVPCGISKSLFSPGSRIVQQDGTRLLCRGCRKLRGGSYCTSCLFCQGCNYQYLGRGVYDPQRWSVDDCRDHFGHAVVDSGLPFETALDTRLSDLPDLSSLKLDVTGATDASESSDTDESNVSSDGFRYATPHHIGPEAGATHSLARSVRSAAPTASGTAKVGSSGST